MSSDPSQADDGPAAALSDRLDEIPPWLRPLAPVVVLLIGMWTVEIVDVPLDGRLDRFGVLPRQLAGLDGVLFAPFLHAGFGHLMANTLPFLVLGGAVAYSGLRQYALVTAIVMAGSGAGMWLFGSPNSLQVGASGLVFGYLTYLLARGFIARRVTWIMGAGVIALFYGSLLWGLIPRNGVSFSGHLFGALSGIGAAWLLHRRGGEEPDNALYAGDEAAGGGRAS
ncbi:MAG: rhomboid family intramembrane serine protease [Microthrixaceae bacterium]